MLTRLKPLTSSLLHTHSTHPGVCVRVGGRGMSMQTNAFWQRTSHLVRFPLSNFKFFELSFQSSFQLSLAVLVCSRAFVGIFSLGWNLPPVLGLHSQTTRLKDRGKTQHRSTEPARQNDFQLSNRIITLFDALFQGTWKFLGCGVGFMWGTIGGQVWCQQPR